MAVHGVVRATEDIDLLISRDQLEEVLSAVRQLGYSVRSDSMKFARHTDLPRCKAGFGAG